MTLAIAFLILAGILGLLRMFVMMSDKDTDQYPRLDPGPDSW